jgi:hypothetical protein
LNNLHLAWIWKLSGQTRWLSPPSNVSCKSSAKQLSGWETKQKNVSPISPGGTFGVLETTFGMRMSGSIWAAVTDDLPRLKAAVLRELA